MRDLRPWWAQWREVYFKLSTLSCALDQIDAPAHKRIYGSGDFEFLESEIAGHYDEIEEQLWAFRNGLSDIAFTIEIKLRRKPRANLRKRPRRV